MDIHSKQLIRLGELIGMSADALRDLITVHKVEAENHILDNVASELDRLSAVVNQIGRSSVLTV